MTGLTSLLSILGDGAGGFAAWAERPLGEALAAAADMEHRLLEEKRRRRG